MLAVTTVEDPFDYIFYQNLTLSRMIEMQKVFSQEIYDFFTITFKSWIDNSKPFPTYDLLIHLETARFFTIHVRKAVITIAYLLRREFWKVFQNESFSITSGNYQNYFPDFTVSISHCLLQFLVWVAYLFEITTYSFKERHNCLDQSIWCLENYTNVFKFHIEGGWQRLNEFSEHFESFYDILNKFTRGCYPESDIFAPFSKAIRVFERHCRYENKMLQITAKFDLANPMQKTSPKFQALLQYDPKRIRLGHISMMKMTSLDQSKPLKIFSHKADEFLSISQTQYDIEPKEQKHASCQLNVEKNIFFPPTSVDDKRINLKENAFSVRSTTLGISTDDCKTEQQMENNPGNVSAEFRYRNSVFVVSNRFLEKRKYINNDADKLKWKRDIKIYSPSKKEEIRVESLKEILDQNIENSNFLEIAEGIHAVCPPEWGDESENWIIVLDTTSEEDDSDSLDIFQQSFMNYAVQELKECRDFNHCNISIMKVLVDEVLKDEMFATNIKYNCTGSSQSGEFAVENNRDKVKVKTKVRQKGRGKRETMQNLNYEADSEDSQVGNPGQIHESMISRKIKRRRKKRNMLRFKESYTAYFQSVVSDH